MFITQADLEMYAGRIRPHFEPELRDTAYESALALARMVGSKVKELRPETSLQEIFDWLANGDPHPADSLDQAEWLMMLEEELDFELPDGPAAKPRTLTFRDLVILRARRRAA